MSIKQVTIARGLKNQKLDTGERETIPVPKDLFPIPTIIAFIAHRGSGKTNAAILLAKEYMNYGSINKVYIISPTYESNPEFKVLDIDEENVYTNLDTTVSDLTKIEEQVKEDAQDHMNYEKYVNAYKKWRKLLNAQHLMDEEEKMSVIMKYQLSAEETLTLQLNHFKEPPKDIPKPRPLLIMDDLSHSDIFSGSKDNPFSNLALRHRHVGGMNYGISIFIMVQTFKTGVPRSLRQGAVQQFCIWKTHDESNLKEIYQSIANSCTYDQFKEMYEIATAGVHDFLVVDPYDRDKNKRFRKNFDTFLIPKSPDNNTFELSKFKKRKTSHN